MSAQGPALALCGSNVAGGSPFSCALLVSGRLLTAAGSAQSRADLAAIAARLCDDAGVRPEVLAELRVDVGPGSYTGLRTALTFARFLQRFGGTRVLACDSLTLLAAASLGDLPADLRIRPLVDARRERLYASALLRRPAELEIAEVPAALTIDAAVASLAPGDVVVTTRDVAVRLGGRFAARGANVALAPTVTAETLFSPWLRLREHGPGELEPRYLAGSYAEG